MDEPFVPGQLYRAISPDQLVEVTPPALAGLKLLVHPEPLKVLKALQKQLRNLLGTKPELGDVLNALVMSLADGQDMTPMVDWIKAQRQQKEQK